MNIWFGLNTCYSEGNDWAQHKAPTMPSPEHMVLQ